MKKFSFLCAVAVLPAVLLSACMPKVKVVDRVCYEEHCFDVEIVDTDETRLKGLQGRESMEDNQGMFFIFPDRQKHRFWMKDTLIPLDIIWIDFNQKVVDIEHFAQPCEEDPCPIYTPDAEAQYVLEINGGMAREIKLHTGSIVEMKFHQYERE